MSAVNQDIKSALKQYFGYSEFKKGQTETIESVLSGNDTLVIMPTGGGKSLCYQLPALLMEGTALVISPLIALMKDQVDTLLKNNIPATFINSSLSYQEINYRINDVIDGKYKLLYLAPERLESFSFLEKLRQFKISFLAVDEAHCISEWGHDFRPAYLSIMRMIEQAVSAQVIALTATATPEVQEDIVYSLKMKEPSRFIRGFDRPNLIYKTEETSKKIEKIKDIITRNKDGSSLIYCGSRKRVEQFARDLTDSGIPAQPYHAGFQDNYRQFVQEGFFSDKFRVIVATNAFGMGIDKPDVRNVIHVDFTQTLEGYYQEAGRGGRDGKPAECNLLWQYSDKNLGEFFINSSHPERNDIINVYEAIFDALAVPVGSSATEPLMLSETEIANRAFLSQYSVSSIISLLENNNILMRGTANGLATMKFTTTKERLTEYFETSEGKRKMALEALLRGTGSETFRQFTEIDLNHISSKYMLKYDELLSAIKMFESARLLRFVPPGTPKGIILKMERLPKNRIPIDFEKIEMRRERAFRKLDIVMRYAQTKDCKRNFILDYFQETDVSGTCGKCSGCKGSILDSVGISTGSWEEILKVVALVAELDKRFGKTMFADILKGKENPKIITYKLNKTKGFGTLSKLKLTDIKTLIESAINEKLIAVSAGLYPTLYVTHRGKELFKDSPVKFRIDFTSAEGKSDNEVYAGLVKLREEIASQAGIVPRAVSSDKTLRLIAQKLPKNIAELESLEGVGYLFISRFGRQFVQRINELIADESQIQENQMPAATVKLIELVNTGKHLNEICLALHLTAAETAKLIQECVESGIELRKERLVEDLIYNLILDYLKKFPRAILKDLRENLTVNVDLPVLRIGIAFARKELSL